MLIGSYRAIRTSGRWSHRYNLKLDGVSGFEPENADIKDRCRNHLAIPQKVAMGWRFELQCRGLTVRCFTELAIPSH